MAPEYNDRNGGTDELAGNFPDFTESPHDGQLSDHDFRRINHAASILTTTRHIYLAFERFAAEVRNLLVFNRLAIHLIDLRDIHKKSRAPFSIALAKVCRLRPDILHDLLDLLTGRPVPDQGIERFKEQIDVYQHAHRQRLLFLMLVPTSKVM